MNLILGHLCVNLEIAILEIDLNFFQFLFQEEKLKIKFD